MAANLFAERRQVFADATSELRVAFGPSHVMTPNRSRRVLHFSAISDLGGRLSAQLRFRAEIASVAGNPPKSKSTAPSIILYSVNKSATQYVKRCIFRCARSVGRVPLDLPGMAFYTSHPYMDRISASQVATRYGHVFRSSGYCFGVFGGLVEGIPSIANYTQFLHVRDPRDVLTSKYYSLAMSHKTPGASKRGGFERQRAETLGVSLDDFVCAQATEVGNRYRAYLGWLETSPGVVRSTYEEMILDPASWLDRVLLELGLNDVPVRVRAACVSQAVSPPEMERPDRKVRAVLPGDHRRKLQPDALQMLNETLEDVLIGFGYEV